MLGYLVNETRRISGTGNIMVEYSDECFQTSCENARWGATSPSTADWRL